MGLRGDAYAGGCLTLLFIQLSIRLSKEVTYAKFSTYSRDKYKYKSNIFLFAKGWEEELVKSDGQIDIWGESRFQVNIKKNDNK